MAFLDPIFNPLLMPLLNMSPFWGIVIISFVISLIITVVYKFATNQELMKSLKEKQKEYQQRIKELRNNPEEMMKVQKEAMKQNMEYMKHSFKPTLITMLPIILIFGWMSGHLGFEPISPGETYSVTAIFKEGVTGESELIVDEETSLAVNEDTGRKSNAKQEVINGAVTWYLESELGEHFLTVKVGEKEETKKVLITEELQYVEQATTFESSLIKQIRINYDKLKPINKLFSTETKKAEFKVPLFNWQPGWLGVYIIFSIIFSMGMRKALKLY